MDWPDAPIVSSLTVEAPKTAPTAGGRPTREQVVEFWKSKGAPDRVAEGITDGLIFESGLNPQAINPQSGAYGVQQALGPRKEKLLSQLGGSNDWRVQLEQAYKDVTGDDPKATAGWPEILGAKDRRTASLLWDKYFERSGTGGTAGWGGAPIVSAQGFRPSDRGIRYAQQSGGQVKYVDPYDLLALADPIADNAREARKGTSLRKSLLGGDELEAIPTIDVADKDGRLKIIDVDGRHRAIEAIKAGVEAVPVSFQGIPKNKEFSSIEGLTGYTRPFNFTPVPRSEPPSYFGAQQPSPGDQAQQQQQAHIMGALEQSRFPYNQPGVTYGNVLPIAKEDETGRLALAAPEGIRSIVRGMIGGGERAMGTGEQGQNPLRPLGPDELAAAGALTPTSVAAGTGARLSEALVPRLAEREPLLPAARPPVGPAVNQFLGNVRGVNAVENAARDIINRRAAQDVAAGGPVPADIYQQLAGGHREGMGIADVAGENIRALLGNVAREPGPGRNIVKQWAINRLGDVDRDSPIATNIERGIESTLATGSARTEARALAEQRAASKPLWDEALAGGSIAPLRTQLERLSAEAGHKLADAERALRDAQNEATQAAARQSQAGNVYATSGANRAAQFAKDKIAEKQHAVDEAATEKAEIQQLMRRAQADDTANARGAVWSRYIGRLLKNPIVQDAIRRGYRIERNIADGENRPFNPKEYAVVGQDAVGDPIVGTVPNMRLLAVAKEGLDAMLESDAYKDQLTGRLNKSGRAVKILRDGLLSELDRLNPAYKPARDKWAGDSALISAIRDGKAFHRQTPEEIGEWFASASESEKEFYRLGAADTMRDDLHKSVFAGDPSKAIVNSAQARRRLLPMFRSAEAASKFLDQVRRARTMFNTPVEVLRGSPTAVREAEDLARRQGLDTVADVLHGVVGSAVGHRSTALYALGRIGNRYINPFAPSPERERLINAAIARLLTDPQIRPSTGAELLQRVPLPKVQNAMARALNRFGAQFLSQGPIP